MKRFKDCMYLIGLINAGAFLSCITYTMDESLLQQKVTRKIDNEIEMHRKNNYYDASLVPAAFDSQQYGQIVFCKKENDAIYVTTHMGSVHLHDEDGWQCIYQTKDVTPEIYEDHIRNNYTNYGKSIPCLLPICTSFVYDKPTKKFHYLARMPLLPWIEGWWCDSVFYDNSAVLIRINNDDSNRSAENFSPNRLHSITLSKDGEIRAVGGVHRVDKKDGLCSFVRIGKKRIYLTENSHASLENKQLYVDHVHFIKDNEIEARVVIPKDTVHLWYINLETDMKIKRGCLVSFGKDKWKSLGQFFNTWNNDCGAFHEPYLYKKLVEQSPYFSLNPKVWLMLQFFKQDDGLGQCLVKDVQWLIWQTWFDVDPEIKQEVAVYDGTWLTDEHEKISYT